MTTPPPLVDATAFLTTLEKLPPLAQLADVIDNLDAMWHGAEVPLPPGALVEHLLGGLARQSARLKVVHGRLSGRLAWAQAPCPHCRGEV